MEGYEYMIQILYDILHSIPIKYVSVSYHELTIFSENDFKNGQIGFRISVGRENPVALEGNPL
ncbi:hypothetical protein D3C77_776550 [compost metagenome]